MSEAQTILKALENAASSGSPWLGMSDIVKATSLDAKVIRPIMKDLMDDDAVEKIGNKRSTKYAISGSEKPEQNSGNVSEESIIDAFKSNEGKSLSRAELCKILGSYDMLVKGPLFDLVKKGIISFNGKKRGQLFWLSGDSNAAEVIVAAPAESNDGDSGDIVVEIESNKPKFSSIKMLIKHGLSNLPQGKKMEITELSSAICNMGNHDFNQWQIIETMQKMRKKNEIPELLVNIEQTELGRRASYVIRSA
jgi:hypothetical protein